MKRIGVLVLCLLLSIVGLAAEPLSNLNIANFSKVLTNERFTSGQTSLTLFTGHGTRLPAVPFRAVLWCVSDFPDPADAYWAGAAEVIEVTARSGNVLTTITRGLEGTTAMAAVAGKVYKLIATPTKAYLENMNPRVQNVRAYGADPTDAINDTSAIMAAYNAIPSTGGVLFFPGPGTYILSRSTLFVSKSNVTIEGNRGAVLKSTPNTLWNEWMVFVGQYPTYPVANFAMRGITLDGNCFLAGPTGNGSLGQSTSAHTLLLGLVTHALIEDCTFLDGTGDHILLDANGTGASVKDCVIRNNYVGTTYRCGIAMASGNGVVIDGNIVEGYACMGIDVEPDNSFYEVQKVSITNNSVSPYPTQLNPYNSDRSYGIAVHSGVVAASNLTEVTNANPIRISINYVHHLATGRHVLITGVAGNTNANGQWAITVLDSDTFTIPQTGNAAWTAGTGTIYIEPDDTQSRIVISGNHISGLYDASLTAQFPLAGIWLREFNGLVVDGNAVFNTRDGISGSEPFAHFGSSGSITANALIRCKGFGINLRSNYSIIGNSVAFSDDAGIACRGFNNVVSGNICRDNGQKAGSTYPYGCWIEYPDNKVFGNIFTDDQDTKTQTHGIWAIDGVTGVTILDNDVRGNITAGIRPPSSLSDNVISRNRGYVTENSGTGSITNGTTAATITHGLAVTPSAGDIHITPTQKSTTSPGEIWVDTIGGTTFKVNCFTDPGATALGFSWAVKGK